MQSMEQLLRDSFENVWHPQTLLEIINGLPDNHHASEVQQCLENLVEKGDLVSKSVHAHGPEEQCTLYWKVVHDKQQDSVVKQQVQPSAHVFTTPRSGIGPPSIRSRQPFKSPARVEGACMTLSMTSPSPAAKKSFVAQTPLSAKHTPPHSLCANQADGDRQNTSPEQVARDVTKLRAQLEEVEQEIKELSAAGCHEEELKMHIDALHEYNEIKDVGQILLGRIAEIEGTTTTSLYERFGLELDN